MYTLPCSTTKERSKYYAAHFSAQRERYLLLPLQQRNIP